MPARRLLTFGCDEADLTELDTYRRYGGYQALEKALRTMTPEAVQEEVTRSNLRGRGGAGFPAGRKWSFLPKDGRDRYLAVNGDEGEPGTYNNRVIIERNPHLLVEGVILACYATQAKRGFIYLRGEFFAGARILERAIADARATGYLGERILGTDFSLEIVVHRGAGAYICGEETALLNSLEGGRGTPRLRPPFPAVAGLYGMPTVINNVETIANVPLIIRHGAAWYRAIGPEASPGTKIFSVSGHVQRPGNYELEMGTTLREIIFEHAGGLRPGRRFKMALPAGASSAAMVAEHLDTPMDFDSPRAVGSMLGSGGIIVLDDTACAVRAAWIGERFYKHESCGQCTPCREGTSWLEQILGRIEHGQGRPEDLELLENLPKQMMGNCLCPLGDFAVTYLQSSLKYFRDEYVAHIERGGCPREVKTA